MRIGIKFSVVLLSGAAIPFVLLPTQGYVPITSVSGDDLPPEPDGPVMMTQCEKGEVLRRFKGKFVLENAEFPRDLNIRLAYRPADGSWNGDYQKFTYSASANESKGKARFWRVKNSQYEYEYSTAPACLKVSGSSTPYLVTLRAINKNFEVGGPNQPTYPEDSTKSFTTTVSP